MIYARIIIHGKGIILTMEDRPRYRQAIEKISKEFKFPIIFLTKSDLQFEHMRTLQFKEFKTPHEFRVYCCNQRHGNK